MPTRLLRPVLVLAGALPLGAMDINDLRLEYAPMAGKQFSAGGQVEFATSSPPNSLPYDYSNHYEVATDAHRHTRSSLDYRCSLTELRSGFGSFVWGFELADDQVSEKQGTISNRGRSEMLDGFIGWAWKLTSSWHIEEGFLVGVGRSRWTQDIQGYYLDGTDWNDEAEGFSYEYGFDIATYYTFARHWQLGLDVRQMFLTSHVRFVGQHDSIDQVNDPNDINTTNADWKYTIEGINLAVALGVRF